MRALIFLCLAGCLFAQTRIVSGRRYARLSAPTPNSEGAGGIPQPVDYEMKIWMACGITTVRDVGSDTKKTLQLRRQSAEDEIIAPRIFVYPMFNQNPTPR